MTPKVSGPQSLEPRNVAFFGKSVFAGVNMRKQFWISGGP